MKSLSRVRLLATPWTAAYQAPLSMDFPARVLEWGAINSLVGPKKVKHMATIGPSNSTLRYKRRRNEDRCSHKNLHTNIHSSDIYHSLPKKVKPQFLPTDE